MRTIALVAALALLAFASPLAAADPLIPAEKVPSCDDLGAGAKCEEIREDVRDMLLCTCPLL